MELALVLPILIMLIFGIIQFGIVFAQKLALSNAAREAARAGTVAINASAQMTCQEIADQIKNTVGTIALNTSDVQVWIILKPDPTVAAATYPPVCSGNTGTSMSNPATTPCTNASSTAQLTAQLIVQVSTPATIAIPFAVSTGVTLTGSGAYRCEYQ